MSNELMQLRKICQHPFLFESVEDNVNPGGYINELIIRSSGKIELLSRILPKFFATDHRVGPSNSPHPRHRECGGRIQISTRMCNAVHDTVNSTQGHFSAKCSRRQRLWEGVAFQKYSSLLRHSRLRPQITGSSGHGDLLTCAPCVRSMPKHYRLMLSRIRCP